jgi:ketosteroid isomerase-like protein
MKRLHAGSVQTENDRVRITGDDRSSFFPSALATAVVLGMVMAAPAMHGRRASVANDRNTVAAMDTEYQAAVKNNDAVTMDKILADNFVLVTASGKTYTKADMLEGARSGDTGYEHNEEDFQAVRVWGDTAVVTARLWEKYSLNGKSFEHKFWFSDTYARTQAGWKYVFGQSAYCLCQKAP